MNTLPISKGFSTLETKLSKAGVKYPKVIITGALIVISAIIIFLVIRWVKRMSFTSNIGKTKEELENELDKINISTGNLTISQGEATIIAQNLLNAMDRWGTDEDAIISNLSRAKTKDDLLLIIQKFGVKPYDGWGLSDTFISNKLAAVMKNLNGWLRAELSGSSLRTVEQIYNKVGLTL